VDDIKNLLSCSPDGKWVYYISDVQLAFMRLPLAGGPAETLKEVNSTGGIVKGMAISPDGKTMALYAPQGDPNTRTYTSKIALLTMDADGKTLRKIITTDPRCGLGFSEPGPSSWNTFHFTPDGKGIALLIEEKGVDNIWVQPIDGSAGHQITHFDSQQIQDFRWSPDGKHLAVIRNDYSGDVILLHDSVQ
jgi:Tol biopolymer transport system component